jgi:hypothetical protein
VSTQPEPCWWMDRGDCWEITHHPTREDAEADHADQVRSDYGWPLSLAGCLEIVPASPRREKIPCQSVRCPDCDTDIHYIGAGEVCCDECDEVLIAKGECHFPDPDQEYLFDVLTAPDDTGQVVTHLVLCQEVGL